jgi:hypothetical protein
MKKEITTFWIVTALILTTSWAQAESSCNCKPEHNQAIDLSSLAQKLEVVSSVGEEDFSNGLKSKYEELVATRKKPVSKDSAAALKVQSETEKAELALRNYLSEHADKKLQLNDLTMKLILDSIYFGNESNPNMVYGDFLLDYYHMNEGSFNKTLLGFNKSESQDQYDKLKSMIDIAKGEE